MVRTRRVSVRSLLVVPLVLGLPGIADAKVARASYFEYVSTSRVAAAKSRTSDRAPCPKNRVVVGGGVYTSGGSLADEVASSAPYDGKDADRRPDDGWFGEINAGQGDATMTTYAICAPFLGVSYRKNSSEASPAKRSDESTPCPEQAPLAYAGGVRTFSSSTKVSLAATIRADGQAIWESTVNNATTKKVPFTTYVICADFRPEAYGAITSGDADVGQQSASVSCPGAYHVVGGGVRVGGGLHASIASLRPEDDPDPNENESRNAPDDIWKVWLNNGTGGPVPFEMSAFCSN